MAIELTTVPVETAIADTDELYFNDVSETPDALNRITYANMIGANLSAIKGLTSAADKGIQFTGAGTAATFDLTTFAKSILDDANEAAFKATVNLEIGTDVQAWDAFLDDIAALTDPGADRLMFWDDSAGEIVWLTLGTGLSITGTTIDAAGGGSIDGSGSAGVLAGWVDSNTLEAVAGLTSPAGEAFRVEAQASGDVGAVIRGNTSDDDNILELRRGSNDAVNVWWGAFGDMTVSDRFITLQVGGETRGGWHGTQGGWMIAPGYGYCFTAANNFNTIDARIERDAAGIIEFNDGSTGGASLQLLEQTAPSAAVANGVRIYAADNGSGKTVLYALFASGSAQQIAIQP